MIKTDGQSSSPADDFASLPEIVAFRASTQANQTAFIHHHAQTMAKITYAELQNRTTCLADFLNEQTMPRQRILLLYPTGIAFATALLACWSIDRIAIPVNLPDTQQSLGRLAGIIHDAKVAIILTTEEILRQMIQNDALQHLPAAPLTPQIKKMGLPSTPMRQHPVSPPIVATDALHFDHPSDRRPPSKIDSHAVALLQYTSGSTGTPKGVMVTHDNLLHNSRLIQQASKTSPDSISMNWMPLYHDMGLMTGIIHPLHVGFPSHLMSPLDFIRNPLYWIQSIARHGITHTGGPNFAYAICTKRFNADALQDGTLAKWQVAFTGAEPIQAETLERFTHRFESSGFRHTAFLPCYGLAEATVGVCWAGFQEGPVILQVDGEYAKHDVIVPPRSLEQTKRFVSSGKINSGMEVVIVDAETQTQLPEHQIGEIWCSGPSVAAGYWQKPEITEQVFNARLNGSTKPYLRTGDLGFISGCELYITGRIKDLVIIRGKNHYPQDIEQSVQKAHPSLRQGGCIAFSVEISGNEELIITQEIQTEPQPDLKDIMKCIRQVLAMDHQLSPYQILLLSPRSIPKTSSGKLQRMACKKMFMYNELKPIQTWTKGVAK